MSRKAAFIIAVGTNGTGKSTELAKRALPINKRNLVLPASVVDHAWSGIPELTWSTGYASDPDNPRKQVPVAVFPPAQNGKPGQTELQTFTGNRVVHQRGSSNAWRTIVNEERGFSNGGLIVDDFRLAIPSKGMLPGYVTNMFVQRRHRMLDIFCACHSFQDINSQMLSWQPLLMIFQTTLAPNDNVLSNVQRPDALLATVARVNERARTNRHHYEFFNPEE